MSVAERRKVVLSLLRLGEPAAVLARRRGISENTLYGQRDELMAAGEAVLANGNGRADPRGRRIVEPTKQLRELVQKMQSPGCNRVSQGAKGREEMIAAYLL